MGRTGWNARRAEAHTQEAGKPVARTLPEVGNHGKRPVIVTLMKDRALRARTAVAWALSLVVALSAATGGGLALISRDDLREWLSYIASDELEGRAIYSSGLGLAAGYIAEHLRGWGATPAGDGGTSYLQTVPVLGVRATSRSTLTIEVAGDSRTFSDGQGVTFPK